MIMFPCISSFAVTMSNSLPSVDKVARVALESQIPAQCRISKTEPANLFLLTLNLVMWAASTAAEYVCDNCGMLFIYLILALVTYALYKSYVRPPIYVKDLTQFGYNHIPCGTGRAMRITREQNAKKLDKNILPPYPNGWFAIAESNELKAGQEHQVDALGLNLCVYRGDDGVARCVDAYCPHLGANLAIGGTVSGNCIQCPFHELRFGANGDCASIPGVETVPEGISIKTWHTMEIDGAVWFWYDAEGRDPLWIIPETPELKFWGFRGRNEFKIHAHIQEIPENGADIAHLNAIHSTSLLTDIGKKYPFLHNIIGQHLWTAEWFKGEEDHIATIDIVHSYMIMKFNLFPLKIKVKQIGPSHVRLMFNSPFGPILVSQSVTPLGALSQKVVNRIYSPAYNAPLGAWMMLAEAYQLKRDVVIWNSKRYDSSPTYVKTDKTIKAFRAWFMQFYSENSIPLKNALQNPLDW